MEAFEVDPRNINVVIGIPSGPYMPVHTVQSLARTAYAAGNAGLRFGIDITAGSSLVTNARNIVLHNFLESDADTLFWIDSDISWTPDDFIRMLGLATKMDVVCATYPLKKDELTYIVNHVDAKNYVLNEYGCIKVNGIGLGFTCVSRRAIEALVATKGKIIHQVGGDLVMADVFRVDKDEQNHLRGEDMNFFFDLKALGYDCWLDPTICLGHVGVKEYKGSPAEALGLGAYYVRP